MRRHWVFKMSVLCVCLVVCSGLWEREFSEESTDRRTFLGKKYTKVLMMHRAGKERERTGCRGLHFQPANKCTEKQSSSKMCWTSARSNLPPFLVITRYLMINLTRSSCSTHRLKATTGQAEFLLWRQCSRSLYDTFFWWMLSSNIMSYDLFMNWFMSGIHFQC